FITCSSLKLTLRLWRWYTLKTLPSLFFTIQILSKHLNCRTVGKGKFIVLYVCMRCKCIFKFCLFLQLNNICTLCWPSDFSQLNLQVSDNESHSQQAIFTRTFQGHFTQIIIQDVQRLLRGGAPVFLVNNQQPRSNTLYITR